MPIPRCAFRNVLLAVSAVVFTAVSGSARAAASTTPEPAPTPAPPVSVTQQAVSGSGGARAAEVHEQIDVTSRAGDLLGIADSAAQGVTGRVDLAQRPILRPGELLETVPGVITTQHAGGGKANQYFLRGFDLDHGTDFGISVDDVPVNMPSHGHGQGYSDLNFTIPELIDDIRYEKGPYDVESGDFSAAGAASMSYLRALDTNLLQVTSGAFGYERLVGAGSETVAGGDLLAGVELLHDDGPWKRPDDYRKGNAVLRYTRGDAGAGWSLEGMGYHGAWSSSDQIPLRAVRSGAVDRLGALDPSDGGTSARYSLSGETHRADDRTFDRLTAYVLRYRLDLFSNFTYFLDDPVHGDQFEQRDERTVGGFRLERVRNTVWRERAIEATYGLQARWDDIRNGLFHTEERALLATTRTDRIRQLSGAPYAQLRVSWTPWLRTVTGLRWDAYRFDVHSNLGASSGGESRSIASPKLAVALGPWASTEAYLDYGHGFHSNDARGTTIRVEPSSGELVKRVSPLVRARSIDVGVRTSALPKLLLAVTAFRLDLDSELVFSGDTGGTEPSRPSRREGVELQAFYPLSDHLHLDCDYARSRSRFTEHDAVGDHIPGSIEDALSAGLTLAGAGRWSGSVRLRYFGPRPLVEDDSVRSKASALVNADIGREVLPRLTVTVQLFNLLDEKVSDIDYYYVSRLPGEPAAGVPDVHFHPAEPRSLRVVAQWRF